MTILQALYIIVVLGPIYLQLLVLAGFAIMPFGLILMLDGGDEEKGK